MTTKRIITLLLITLPVIWFGCGKDDNRQQPVDLQWDSNRPLTWNDFMGTVDPNAPADVKAGTSYGLTYKYDFNVRRTEEGCFFEITDIHAEAIFRQGSSWVRPGQQTPVLLKHEQGHFDIVQIHKLQFDERVRTMVGTGGPCEGATDAEIRAFIRARIVGLVQPIFDVVFDFHERTQERYDNQTQHGTISDMQDIWNQVIQNSLR